MSESRTAPRCVCSTVGLSSPHWRDYFPEECPKEWQTAYFMNDFRAVYLTPDLWLNNVDYLIEIESEIEGDFEIVVELPTLLVLEEIETILKQLAPIHAYIACVVIKIATTDDALLESVIEQFGNHYSLALRSQYLADSKAIDFAKKHKASMVWEPDKNPLEGQYGEYHVVLLSQIALREMRTILTSIQSRLPVMKDVGIFILPEGNSTQCALQTRTLIELLELG